MRAIAASCLFALSCGVTSSTLIGVTVNSAIGGAAAMQARFLQVVPLLAVFGWPRRPPPKKAAMQRRNTTPARLTTAVRPYHKPVRHLPNQSPPLLLRRAARLAAPNLRVVVPTLGRREGNSKGSPPFITFAFRCMPGYHRPSFRRCG